MTAAGTAAPLDRRRVLAWCLFDFANSNYSAVVTATVFSVYYAQVIVGNERGAGDLWWGRAVASSMLAVALTGPLLGALADRTGRRKQFLLAFTTLCVASIALFTTIEPGMVLWGFALAALTNFAFESGLVYYNAYLPEIVPPERRGFVSGLGFGIGYAGSIAGLLIALPLVQAQRFDLIWVMVAGWFALFAIPTFLWLPAARAGSAHGRGFLDLLRDVYQARDLRRFLLAYFVYLDGVETTIYFSGIFASQTFGFTTTEVIKLFLAVQASALVGALALANPTDRLGPKRTVAYTLVFWMAIALAAFLVQSKAGFAAVAVTAGAGLGVIQAASRALMASLIPQGKEAEMFGFYAFCGKSSSVLGPLVFGGISYALGGNQRAAVLGVGSFFLIGLLLLQRVGANAER